MHILHARFNAIEHSVWVLCRYILCEIVQSSNSMRYTYTLRTFTTVGAFGIMIQ